MPTSSQHRHHAFEQFGSSRVDLGVDQLVYSLRRANAHGTPRTPRFVTQRASTARAPPASVALPPELVRLGARLAFASGMADLAWFWRKLAQLGGVLAVALVVATSSLSCSEDGPERCHAAGGECKLGGFACAVRGSQDCNPERNPGGAFCCLQSAARRNPIAEPPAADSGGPDASRPTECRGPGYYETGKGNTYMECCAGLHEVFVGKTGYQGGANGGVYEPSCDPPPLRVSACVSGSCGDGICEPEGEGQLCGCVQDCPSAVFTWSDAVKVGKLTAVPAGCEKSDLVSGILGAVVPIDCGDLDVDAPREQQLMASACARNAFGDEKAFQLFWRTVGVDSIVHRGIVGHSDGGVFRTFRVHVDADPFGIDFPGAIASWSPCTAAFSTICDGDIASCLRCEPDPGEITCGCLPEGPRPGQPPGSTVEFRCEQR